MKPFTAEEMQKTVEEALRRVGADPDDPVWNEWVCALLGELESQYPGGEFDYYSAEQFREAVAAFAASLTTQLKMLREASVSLLAKHPNALADYQKECLKRILQETSDGQLKVAELLHFADTVVELLESR